MAGIDIYTALDVARVVAFPLNNDGSFNLDSVNLCDVGVQDLYEGVEFAGPVGFDVSFGAPRQIPVVAQGQVQATFIMPSIEARTGKLRCAFDKLTLDAMLSGLAIDTIAEAKAYPEDTDRSGKETLVALLLQQLQAKDDDGSLVWRSDVIHRATIVPSPTGYSAEVMVKEYDIAMSRSSKRMWGESYSLATHKCLEAAKDIVISGYQWNIGVWMGDNVLTTFNLPAGKKAKTSAKAKVWNFVSGATESGTWDNPTDAQVFTPTTKPTDGEVLVVTYEHG